MEIDFGRIPSRLFGHDSTAPHYLAARWLFLRALGLIFFSAFYSLVFQIRGLIGPNGLLPARDYLVQVARVLGSARFWYAPTLFWWSSSDRFLLAVCIVGILASLLLTVNISPRGMLAICLVAFLSFIAAAQDFASYQSDGMLLEAGFISLFFAPSGWRPRWGAHDPPSRASRYLLIWLMFRIYFESGVAKILGHDPEWHNFTAMDEYYQNGPLPTWIGWYVQHLPHAFHVATAFFTLALELVLIFAIFLPRPSRILSFFVITPWQICIILTANYAFLNYIVMVLGILLLDDRFLTRFFPRSSWAMAIIHSAGLPFQNQGKPFEAQGKPFETQGEQAQPAPVAPSPPPSERSNVHGWRYYLRMSVEGFFLTWIFYVTFALLLFMMAPTATLFTGPIRALEPFRIANEFGLFAVMTRGRYEIEFQGSSDGVTWTAYPFRYKPQDVREPPRIYAPYQPRFDWNLWFASLGNWREYRFVLRVEERLLEGEPDVLVLFSRNPFQGHPPDRVRAVIWQYWFTSWAEKRQKGDWWRREEVGLYAPALESTPEGKIVIFAMPGESDTSR